MTSAIAGWLVALLVASLSIANERRRAGTRAARIDRLTGRVDRELGRWVLAKERAAEQWLDLAPHLAVHEGPILPGIKVYKVDPDEFERHVAAEARRASQPPTRDPVLPPPKSSETCSTAMRRHSRGRTRSASRASRGVA
jgi:hypothetical protein